MSQLKDKAASACKHVAPAMQQIQRVGTGATQAAQAVASATTQAVAAAVQPSEPPPPQRECWTYGLLDSCCADPGFASYACVCPCVATSEIDAYRKTKDPNAPADGCDITCQYLMFCFGDQCGMTTVRNQIREDTNMVHSECCNKACWDICLSTVFCWGCAAVQMKRELQVWFGHAGPEAPVHPGSPAARKA